MDRDTILTQKGDSRRFASVTGGGRSEQAARPLGPGARNSRRPSFAFRHGGMRNPRAGHGDPRSLRLQRGRDQVVEEPDAAEPREDLLRRHAYATAFYGKWYLGDTKPCYPTGKIRAPVRFELAGEIPLVE